MQRETATGESTHAVCIVVQNRGLALLLPNCPIKASFSAASRERELLAKLHAGRQSLNLELEHRIFFTEFNHRLLVGRQT